ncbi:hypothetical protein PRIC1_010534 [Phytophthora ramorum]
MMTNGMRKKSEELFNMVEIHTTGDLRKRLKDGEVAKANATTPLVDNLTFGFLREVLAAYDKKLKRPWLKKTLESIPQFVWRGQGRPRRLSWVQTEKAG